MKTRPSLGAWAGVAGIVIPGAGLAVLPIWQFPGTGQTGEQIAQFASEHQSALQLVMLLNTLGVALWLVFGLAVWQRLAGALRSHPATPPSETESVLTTLVGVGTLGFVTLLLAGFTAFDVLVREAPPAHEAKLLYDLAFGLLAMSGMPTALALGAYALVRERRPVLPRFTGVLAALTAVVHAALLLSFVVPSGFFSLEGQVITVAPAFLWAWILSTALAMARPDAARRGGPTSFDSELPGAMR